MDACKQNRRGAALVAVPGAKEYDSSDQQQKREQYGYHCSNGCHQVRHAFILPPEGKKRHRGSFPYKNDILEYMAKYSESIFGKSRSCWVCGRSDAEIHHIFYGPLRSKSEKWGLKVCLCRTHHENSGTGVHGGNRELDIELKQEAQKRFEAKYGHEKFMEEFGRNWL